MAAPAGWTPVDEAPSASSGDASAWTPVQESPAAKKSWLAASEAKPRSVVERVGTGLMDAAYGTAQFLEHELPLTSSLEMSRKAVEARGGPSVPTMDPIVQRREQDIQQARAAGGETGIDWGRIAGNVANPLNYVPIGAGAKGTTLGNIGRAAIQGGLSSVEQPVASGDFAAEKAEQLGIGTGAGAAAGGVMHAIAKAAEPVVTPVLNFVKGIKGPEAVKDAGVQEILRRIGQDTRGGGPTAQDMLDLLNAAPGKPLTLMDVGGENLKALAGRIARAPGEARQTVQNFINERDLNAGLRLSDDVNKGIHSGNAYDVSNALAEARRKAAAPLYDEAFKSNQNIGSPEIDAILATPAGTKALKQAGVKMQNDMTLAGKPDPEIMQQIKESGQYVPFKGGVASGLKLRTLDYVKRSLDDQISTAQRAGENDEVRILTGLKGKLVGALDAADTTAKPGLPGKIGQRAATPATPGAYARARQVYSGTSQSMEALESGKNFLKNEPQENAALVSSLSQGDKEFFKIGAASQLRKQLAKTGPSGDESKKIIGNAYTRAQLRPLFDNDADYDKFINSVTAENRMFNTGSDVLGNSRTAARLAEDNSHENAAYGKAAKAGVDAASGNWLGAAKSTLGAIGDLMRSIDPAVNSSMARTLTTPLSGNGMQLLRDFAQHAPVTKNYLTPLVNPTVSAIVPPLAIGASQAAAAP